MPLPQHRSLRRSARVTVSLAILGVAAVRALALEPVLNEFVASNSGGLRDADGDSSDWIEIYNPNPSAIDLGGYRLRDLNNEWIFPTGSQVAANGYRIVFASSKNRTNAAAELHTNFSLGASGEALSLLTPSEVVVTAYTPAFPEQRTNLSYGRTASGPAFFATPTPGAANGAAFTDWVRDVSFSAARGFCSEPFSLALSTTTPGAVIRFTTDGSTPTETNGTVYSAPISVSETRTLRARAFLANQVPSLTGSHTYLFLDSLLANQVYATGTAPSGWPVGPINGQIFRYGWNTSIKGLYGQQQLIDGLKQIPSVSIVTDQPNLTNSTTGIYVNGTMKGDEWERPASVEYLPGDGSDSFHIDCGLRIRGGASRNDGYPKHSLRLHFRGKYGGKGSLEFPIHGEGGTDEFDTLDLRTEQNYHWANQSTGTQNTAVREVFCRDLIGAMGQPTTRTRYVHLYLNGQYWGIYQTEERAQENYGASYFGGEAEDYDVIQTSNHPNFTYELSSGTINAWQTLWNLAKTHRTSPTNVNLFVLEGRDANGQRDLNLPVYVELDHLIAYMLLHYYTGDGDAPLSNFLGMNRANNWRGMRDRNGADGFRFFVHDSEHTLLAPSWVNDRVNTGAPYGSNRDNFTYSNPEWIHENLIGNAEYRLRFADVAQKHLFNGGVMTPAVAQGIFDARAAQVAQAIVPDVARWGQNASYHSLAQWNSRLNDIRANFFPSRPANLLGHLRTRGLFPTANAPVFSLRGGKVEGGTLISLSAGSQTGTVYYTLDGSDPRAIGGAATGIAYSAAIPINGQVKVRTRFRSSSGVWSALDEAAFTVFPHAVVGDLVVSKVHYNPPAPTTAEIAAGFTSSNNFEYLEVMNIRNETVDLSGVGLEVAAIFDFAASPLRMLPPDGRVVIAGNPAALQFRHGPGLPIAGSFAGDLSNGGERIRLIGSTGDNLLQFNYNDVAPWPKPPDGGGFALVLKEPAANPDHDSAGSWRASTALGGRPGEADALDPATWRTQFFTPTDLADPAKETTVWGDEADPDGDGFANLVEMVTGTIPNNGASRELPTASWWTDPESSARYLTLTCRLREEMAGVTVVAEASGNLTSWPDQLTQTGVPQSLGDGTMRVTFRDTLPVGEAANGHRFLRLKVLAD